MALTPQASRCCCRNMVLHRPSAFVSTPDDLLNITNAKEIFAVDYLQENNSRRAAILAISTEPSRVYEHTKVICDRLIGAELQEVRMIEIAGRPFIMSKLVHPNGYVDYSVSFIAQRNMDGFVVDTRWYNDEYNILNTDDVFNFQVWSVAPQLTRELVEDILDQWSQTGNVSFRNATISRLYQRFMSTADVIQTVVCCSTLLTRQVPTVLP
jgi:hypothetical protein